jgi:hypothetical protein
VRLTGSLDERVEAAVAAIDRAAAEHFRFAPPL